MADFANMAQVWDLSGLRPTLGAVLIGSIVSVFLSGSLAMQVALYYRIYRKDHFRFKLTVAMIWVLDILHTIMISMANWQYLIDNFGNNDISDTIVWTVAVTIALTAIITFFVHCFFAHRILALSKRNWFITVPIVVLAILRLAFALVTTTKMITIKTYSAFIVKFSWSFTLGLTLATAVDIMIAAALCWYLNKSRTGFSSMDNIIDSITLYTLENGLLTCVTTVVSLICWLTMPHNLIFLGLHFAISKLYSNAFLATLNARKVLRGRSQASSDRELPVLFPENFTGSRFSRREVYSRRAEIDPITTKVQINVEKTIQHDGEADPSDVSNPSRAEEASLKLPGASNTVYGL
ncbi:unnamed protein product [Somion occarium]|uniref:DUF6534 domain-containing protein n=1 Tax=Somion occarium TaxID=3059160 RepID=A0ABP1EDD5_9APHY